MNFHPLGSSKMQVQITQAKERIIRENIRDIIFVLEDWRNIGNELAFTRHFYIDFLKYKWSVINHFRFETLSLMLHFSLEDFSVLTAYWGFDNRPNLFKSKLINNITRQSIQMGRI